MYVISHPQFGKVDKLGSSVVKITNVSIFLKVEEFANVGEIGLLLEKIRLSEGKNIIM